MSRMDPLEKKLEIVEQRLKLARADFAKISANQSQLIRKQVGEITDLKAAIIKLEEENSVLREQLALSAQQIQNVLTIQESSDLKTQPYIRKEFYSVKDFTKLLETLSTEISKNVTMYFALTTPHMSSLGIEKSRELIEQYASKLIIGIISREEGMLQMRILDMQNLTSSFLIMLPSAREKMNLPLKPGDLVSAIPNPHLFGQHLTYKLPKILRQQIADVYDNEGPFSEGNSSYKVCEYPILCYQGDLNFSVIKKGKIEFLLRGEDRPIMIEY